MREADESDAAPPGAQPLEGPAGSAPLPTRNLRIKVAWTADGWSPRGPWRSLSLARRRALDFVDHTMPKIVESQVSLSLSLPRAADARHDLNMQLLPTCWEHRRLLRGDSWAIDLRRGSHEGAAALGQRSKGARRSTRRSRRAERAERALEAVADGTSDGASDTSDADLGCGEGGRHKELLLVRHAEAQHNASWSSHASTRDPELTERGVEQARLLGNHPRVARRDLLVVSPMRRAIETAVAAFGETPSCHTRVVISPLHTERCAKRAAACNSGSPKSELVARFPFMRAWEGFDELAEAWTPTVESDRAWKTERVPAFLNWIERQPEDKVVVIGHGAFFSHSSLAGRFLSNCEIHELRLQRREG